MFWLILFLVQFKFDLNIWVILVCFPSKTLQIFRRSRLKPSDVIEPEFRWRIVSCHLDCTVVNHWDMRAVRVNTSLAFAKWPHKVERSKIYCGVDWRPGVKAQNQQWAAGKRPISRSLKPSIVWPLYGGSRDIWPHATGCIYWAVQLFQCHTFLRVGQFGQYPVENVAVFWKGKDLIGHESREPPSFSQNPAFSWKHLQHSRIFIKSLSFWSFMHLLWLC